LVPVANAIAGQYIVVLRDQTNRIQPMMSAQGVTEVKTLRQGYAAKIAAQALAKILADPNVAYVQQDGIKSVTPIHSQATESWALSRIDQRDLPLDNVYEPGGDGAGVNVAVVDTGITNVQAEFEGRMQFDCFTAYNNDCTDGHGHGTFVAGEVGGKTWGVAKKALLWRARVLDANGSGSDSAVIGGINWVVQQKAQRGGDWVLNMSLGGSDSPALNRATCDAIAAGVTVAVAAGNEGQDADTSSPARVIQAITVGASDKLDTQAGFSNWGTLLDLYAPGVDVTSVTPSGMKDTWSGTSMATPLVAGTAALYLQRHPGSNHQTVRDGLVQFASQNKLAGLSAGSPNALLYVKE
jgi:subtilisin family serine protease